MLRGKRTVDIQRFRIAPFLKVPLRFAGALRKESRRSDESQDHRREAGQKVSVV